MPYYRNPRAYPSLVAEAEEADYRIRRLLSRAASMRYRFQEDSGGLTRQHGSLVRELLTLVGHHRDDQGGPNFLFLPRTYDAVKAALDRAMGI